MKKNILLFLMLLMLLIVVTTDAQAQESQAWCSGDTEGAEACYYEDSCCYENSCCVDNSCCVNRLNFYAKVFGGANFLQSTKISRNTSKYHTGYLVSGSLGYSWCYGLRLEGEYAFRRNAINKIHLFGEGCSKHGHFQTSSYMVNLLGDVPLSWWSWWRCALWKVRPFVGAGIGYDCEHMHSSNSCIIFHQKWHHFSWQVMAGVAYPIFCKTELTLEYKYHQGGCHFKNHSVGVGLVYTFGL